MDPAELRRRNFIPPDRFPYKTATGFTYDSGEYRRALDRLLDHAGRDELLREQARRRTDGGKLLGIGIACYVEICGFGPFETGTVQVHAEGSATVLTGTSPHGQGHETTFAQIVADTLQLPLDAITVKHGDTGVIPVGIGTFGSRSAAVGGSAVLSNSRTVLEQARRIAAGLLEAAEDDVLLGEGRFHVKGAPGRGVTWPQVVDAADDDELSANAPFEPANETYPFGAHLSLVEIDPETGHVELLRHVTVDDCGKVINPLLVEGQVHGGIAQGVGQALWEEAIHDEHGHLLTGSLMDYALPRIDRLPSYETHRTETPSPLNPLGVKGVGEAGAIASPAAVTNAVVDALKAFGVTHVDMPLTPEKIWRLIQRDGRS